MTNMQFSYSRVECYKSCPYKFKLHYIDKIRTIQEPAHDNALIVGNALHLGLETDKNLMLNSYYDKYPLINDKHINEAIKLELLLNMGKEVLSDLDILYQEYEINVPEFKGIVDLILKNDDGTIDVLDFKYSNNVDRYLESGQLHVYKYFLEKIGFKVKRLGFIFFPKTMIRQKRSESLFQFRRRLINTVNGMDIKIIEINYEHEKVSDFINTCNEIRGANEYPKNQTKLCNWCDFQNYCEKGETYMILPENKRRERKIDDKPDMWIYGPSYVGKSTFIDKIDNLLFLNTDGNVDNTTSAQQPIVDIVTVEGRITKRKFAWELFKECVEELEKKENGFKTICIDLVEDLYEHCRLYMYDKHGWEHESDGNYGKGWDMIKTEYLSVIKRLKSLGYQIIYISKECTTEVTLKNGAKYTTYAPNVNSKIANVLAGTVDLTVRAYVDGSERYLQLEKTENSFGGGRFNFKQKNCKLDMNEFKKALYDAQEALNNITEQYKENSNEDEIKKVRKSRKSE